MKMGAKVLLLAPMVLLVFGSVEGQGYHNYYCIHGSVEPVCACLPGYSGDALTQCVNTECMINSECRGHQICVNQHCIDPCAGACGVNAYCDVLNHIPVCTCPPGYTGNPFSSCRIADPGVK